VQANLDKQCRDAVANSINPGISQSARAVFDACGVSYDVQPAAAPAGAASPAPAEKSTPVSAAPAAPAGSGSEGSGRRVLAGVLSGALCIALLATQRWSVLCIG
jgi:hypothetical protein